MQIQKALAETIDNIVEEKYYPTWAMYEKPDVILLHPDGVNKLVALMNATRIAIPLLPHRTVELMIMENLELKPFEVAFCKYEDIPRIPIG